MKETLCIFLARGAMLVSSPVALLNCFSAGFSILSFGKRGALGALCLTSLYSMYSCVISLSSTRTKNLHFLNAFSSLLNLNPRISPLNFIFLIPSDAAIKFLIERNASSSLSKSFPKHLHSIDLSFSSQSPLVL